MAEWSARLWVAGIVGLHPMSLMSQMVDSNGPVIVRYSDVDGRYLGQVVRAGPINLMSESEPEGGHYEVVFEAADGKVHHPGNPIPATTEILF
jgi:hypothetical protein